MPWGDFTTNGDEDASGEWGPDGEGRMWKWAEWKDAGDYSVSLTGGLYHVLTVGGGSRGANSDPVPADAQGQAGLVSEGYWEFPVNPTTSIMVGSRSLTNQWGGGWKWLRVITPYS